MENFFPSSKELKSWITLSQGDVGSHSTQSLKIKKGSLYKYAKCVSSASEKKKAYY